MVFPGRTKTLTKKVHGMFNNYKGEEKLQGDRGKRLEIRAWSRHGGPHILNSA